MTDQDTNSNGLTRSQGRRKSNFPGNTGIPAGATLDFVAAGVNYKISLAAFTQALNVTGTIVQDGDPLGVPILDTEGTVHLIRNLEVAADSGLSATISAINGVTLALDAQVASGTGIAVLDSTNKIRNVKAGAGITLTLVDDDIVISLT